ncbi:hypothetical protein ACP4OV_026000 [Aristida adscensionis]
MRQARPYSGMFCGGVSARTGPHALPLARIKKIMKRSAGEAPDGGARMISGEAPVVFSKACELFIAELTRRAWAATLDGKRRTVHKEDVADAVRNTDLFDFLVDVVMADAAGAGAGAHDGVDDGEMD